MAQTRDGFSNRQLTLFRIGDDQRRVRKIGLTPPSQVLDGGAFADQAGSGDVGSIRIVFGEEREHVGGHRPGAPRRPRSTAGGRVGRKRVQQRRSGPDEGSHMSSSDCGPLAAWLSHMTDRGQGEAGSHAIDPALDLGRIRDVQEAIR